MGKRYHCEYCNRSFADTPHTRKNHINGVQHKRNRKLHYDSFKDPAVLLAEEATKPPCRKFFETGSCGFGASCWYSHTNPQMLLAAQSTSGQKTNKLETTQPAARLEDWIKKWEKRQKKNERGDAEGNSGQQTTYTLPPGMPPLQLLPPSLLPPPPTGYPEIPRVDWGWLRRQCVVAAKAEVTS